MLTDKSNMIRESDVLKMKTMEYSLPGEEGEGIIWDFSDVNKKAGERTIEFFSDTLMNIRAIDCNEIYDYKYSNGLLQKIQNENRLGKITYYEPMMSMVYPLQYGDSASHSFKGHGTYCKSHLVQETGHVILKADGLGTLVLSDKDTLKNVLRVFTVISRSIAMDMDSIALDTAKVKLEIEEKYDWYVRGYRYPLYEIVQKTSYSNMLPVASKSIAYRILPDSLSMTISEDNFNDSIRYANAEKNEIEYDSKKEIFHYSVSKKGSIINVDFYVDEEATVVGLITNIRGMMFKNTKMSCPVGEYLRMSFDCNGLPRGQYALYINVNGKVYSEIISLQ